MNFSSLPVDPQILAGIAELGFKEPTVVQEKVIPEALKGHDIRACAQTGTGKTIAFVIPILNALCKTPDQNFPKALIITPTRELGAQVHTVIKEVGKFTQVKAALILGGSHFDRQVKQIKSGAQIIVATPGRLLDHVRRRTINLKKIEILVMDEGDRMLDMGFLPDIQSILSHCPPKKQTMLFSATFPLEIQNLVSRFLKDPISFDLAPSTPANTVTQMVYPVSKTQKEQLLLSVLEHGNISSGIIFCRTKMGADRLVMALKKVGKSVAAMHSDKSQRERTEALLGFRHKKFQLLVATDIAARGIDIKDVSHVINYDVPQHPEDYVHRIGRTGRAQSTGDAFTLVSLDEEAYIRKIERFIKNVLPRGVIPDFPYLVPPRLTSTGKSIVEGFGRKRRRIPTGRFGRRK